jgi:hypothetical protein
MRHRGDAIGQESVNEPGDERGPRVAGEIADQQIGAEPGERERGDEEEVVAKDDVAGQPVDRQDLQRLAEEVFGKRERQRIRMKDVGVPELGPADRAEQESRDVLRPPRQNPHVEQGVAEIAGHIAAEAGGDGPGQNQRQDEISKEGTTGLHAGSFSLR